jgi:hypothetical protein
MAGDVENQENSNFIQLKIVETVSMLPMGKP